MSWKVLSGNAKHVENELNELEKSWIINVVGISATDNLTTVVIKIEGNKKRF